MPSQFGLQPGPGSAVGAQSVRGSELGYGGGMVARPASFGGNYMPTLQSQMSFGPGSMGGMPPPMSSLGMGNRRQSHMSGLSYGGLPGAPSVYSMAAFAPPAPSPSASPTDAELVAALKANLASQDLMTVTKRTAREGLQALFPNAELGPRRDAINAMIDGVLQGRL